MTDTPIRRWQDITPQEAADQKLDLSKDMSITAPLNEFGERCPWPWDPQQLVGAPLGQYHCPYCGGMVMAGVEHLDYTGFDEMYEQYCKEHENDPPSEEDLDIPSEWLTKNDPPF